LFRFLFNRDLCITHERMKMSVTISFWVATHPLLVEKLANSSLLATFSASIGDIPATFYFDPELYRGP
jgi:hypothetical protein